VFELHQNLFYLFAVLIGLCTGSFINVVRHRLPIMLNHQWQQACHQYLGQPGLNSTQQKTPFNLLYPRSHCPHCKHTLKAWQLIPILSYCLQKGRCHFCKQRISSTYPVIEIISALITLYIFWAFNDYWQILFLLILAWSSLSLAVIDVEHQLLPDQITIPLIWLGLLANSFGLFIPVQDAIIGAIVAYSALWIIAKCFRLLRGKDGMGYGDFKTFAIFGAWLGWQSLPSIILLASVSGVIISIGLILRKKINRDTPVPFGPFIIIAGWLYLSMHLLGANDMLQIF
jgi:leader peptidase (prepilin peptidase) / N-methyltransferase